MSTSVLNVANIVLISYALKKSHMVPVLSRSREFSLFWMVLVPVPEKIGPGKKYRYQKKILGTVALCWMHHDDEANYDITLNSVAWTVSLTFCMFYI